MRLFKRIKSYSRFIFESGTIHTVKKFNLEDVNTIRIVLDILFCKLRYGILTKEYLFFSFYEKSHYARKQFVGTREREKLFKSLYNEGGNRDVFRSKAKTFEFYKAFFKRDLIQISLPDDQESLHKFLDDKGKIIVKPLSSSQGRGICVLSSEGENDNPTLFNLADGQYVAEEFIVQDSTMASFHPESVNTIRYVTYYNKGQVFKLFALIRMGVGHSCVDNTCAGGISAAVDLSNGVVVSEAASQNGMRYSFHPDTGTQILGAHIPQWESLNELLDKIVRLNPSITIAGWDFALSDKGWCLVEGNSLPSFFGIQIALNKGIRPILKYLS